MDKMRTSEELLIDADIFAQHIIIALRCLGECRAMDKIFSSPQHKEQYPVAGHFYHTAYHAMRYRFQMEVAKLFDAEGNSMPFDRFKNSICRANLIDQVTVTEYTTLKRRTQDDLTEIKNRRDKVYAHSDVEFFNIPDKYIEDHSFNDDIIEALLSKMLSICNEVIFNLTIDDCTPPLRLLGDSDDFIKLFGYETAGEIASRNFLKNEVVRHAQLHSLPNPTI